MIRCFYDWLINLFKKYSNATIEGFLCSESKNTSEYNVSFYLEKLSKYSLLSERNANILVIKIFYLIKANEIASSNKLQKNFETFLKHYNHQIITTINEITNLAESTLIEQDPKLPTYQIITEIYNHSCLLFNESNKIKDFFLLQNNDAVFYYCYVSLKQLVIEIINNFKSDYQEKVKFNIESYDNLDDTIAIDKLKMIQAIKYIISTIINYFKSDKINITLTKTVNNFELQIKYSAQHSKSISDEELRHLFDLYFIPKSDSNNINQENHIGFDLAYSKLVIEQNKGEIYCTNDPDTKTVAFHILFKIIEMQFL